MLIQETKKESFSRRTLNSISNSLDLWHWLPSKGKSGGILFGGDSTKLKVISCQVYQFSLDIVLENKIDSKIWELTVVYGPVKRSLKRALWSELDQIRQPHIDFWVLSGDFNVIRNSSEKSGHNFDIPISRMFNSFINRHNLIEHKLGNRRYTWTNGRHFALLDRVFTSVAWDRHYSSSSIIDLSSYGSDHCPLVLQSSSHSQHAPHSFRFDPSWVEIEEFNRLVGKWWDEFQLDLNDIGNSWNNKLKHMRKRISGWAKNYYGKKKKDKQNLLSRLHHLELVQELSPLSASEQAEWLSIKASLDEIYLEEEIYWKTRAKHKWLEEGDLNTKFFHAIASHRKKKNRINSLEIDGVATTNLGHIQKHVVQYYRDILGTEGVKFGSLDPSF